MPAARSVASPTCCGRRASADGAATTAAQRIVSEIVSGASCTDPLARESLACRTRLAPYDFLVALLKSPEYMKEHGEIPGYLALIKEKGPVNHCAFLDLHHADCAFRR